MPILRRKKEGDAAFVVVASLAGREDLLPDFAHPLSREQEIIGRHESCTIQLVDGQISRQHLRIRHDEERDRYFAVDMGSANGTLVNGSRIQREHMLDEGDTIEIGNSRLVFTRRRFKDHQTALQHFRKAGEHGKGTLIK